LELTLEEVRILYEELSNNWISDHRAREIVMRMRDILSRAMPLPSDTLYEIE
jgi:hypothetical protein